MKPDFRPILIFILLTATLVALPPQVSAQDLGGSWVLDVTAEIPEETSPCIYSGDSEIQQDGSSLTGTIVLALVSGPAACPPEVTGTIDGTVEGDSVFGTWDGGQLGTADFQGTASNGSLAGTFQANPEGPFAGTDGSWQAVRANPSVGLVKSGTFDDESGDGFAQAGETISYSFAVTNTGNQTLSSITVSDPMVSPISCPSGNPIPSLAPGATETCTGTYAVTQADVDAGSKDNTATVEGENPDGDPVSESHTTSTTLIAPPGVSATKVSDFDLSTQDNDGTGDLTPGDDLTYTVTITNDGSGEATGAIFDDTPDPNTELVVGSVTTTQGTVVLGNTAGDTAVQVTVGTLTSGGSATVTFEVTIDDPLPEGVTSIINQGTVSGDNFDSVVTDDPGTASSNDGTSNQVNRAPAPLTEIPTLAQWGLLLLALLLSTVAARRLQR